LFLFCIVKQKIRLAADETEIILDFCSFKNLLIELKYIIHQLLYYADFL
jgi:hypothetical protein